MDRPCYREMLDRVVSRRIHDLEIPVVSCEDLVLLKLAAGRPVDVADAQALVEINRPALDTDYLRARAASMGLENEVEELVRPPGP